MMSSARPCLRRIPVRLLVVLLLALAGPSQDRVGTLLYNVPFATPPHTVGLEPVEHLPNAPPPRNAPTDVYGDPTVVGAVGNLTNQPCRFDASGEPGVNDGLRFVTGTVAGGFDVDYWFYHVEGNLAVHALGPNSYFNIVVDDTYTVTFIHGFVTVASQTIGSYIIDDPLFVEIDVDIAADTWIIRLDGTQVHSGLYLPNKVDYVRFLLHDGDPGNEVGLDDVRICGGGTCQPTLRITDQPSSLVACTGHDAAFSVTAAGNPPLQYQWRHDFLDITGATTSTCSIQAVDHPDAGQYDVRVVSGQDTLYSYPATLAVHDHVAFTLQPGPAQQTLCRGQSLLYASTATGTPPLQFQWRRDGQPVPGQTWWNYIDSAIDTSEAGVYDVIVFNTCSSDTSNAVTLLVDAAPWITQHPAGRTVCVGDSLTLTAAADGLPAPTLQWFRGGTPVGSGPSFHIAAAALGDAGSYTVTATNHCGSATSNPAVLGVLPWSLTVPDDRPTIQAALDAVCGKGGTVTVRNGRYFGPGNVSLNFHGKQLTLRSESDDPRLCVIDGQGSFRGVIFNSGEGAGSVLRGFTIRDGEAWAGRGGGILCQGASPTIQDCIVESCHAAAGGGMAGIGFTGALLRCTFTENAADSLGGGLLLTHYAEPSPAANCTFYANGARWGGGIGLYQTNLTLDNTIIAYGSRGPAITCQWSSVTLSCCDIWGNAGGDWNEPCQVGQLWTSGNIMLNPFFQDRFAGDFTLQANSPCAPFTPPNPECGLIGAWPANAVFSDDDGLIEYGVEYVDDYEGTKHDRTCGVLEADSLRGVLYWPTGWSERLRNGDGDAHWRHWAAEEEEDYIDEADLVYFSGHGTDEFDYHDLRDARGPSFQQGVLLPGDCDSRWGDTDLEWLAFTACSMLNDDDDNYWASAFNGAHMILGFKTYSTQDNRAREWADQMISRGLHDPAKRVAWSWFKTCDNTQEDGVTARVLDEDGTMCYDFAWGQEGGPRADPVVDNWYSHWDHDYGDPDYGVPALRSGATLPSSLTVYDAAAVAVDSAGVAQLGESLGVYGPAVREAGAWWMASGNRYLKVSETAGVDYGDLSRLWRPRSTSPALPGEAAARGLATSFLSAAGLLPAGADPPVARFTDVQARVNRSSGEVEQEFPTDVQVLFHRNLDGWPVVGPGGKVLAYVGEGGKVDGATQVWRSLSAAGSVTLLDSAAVMAVLERHGQRATLGGMPRLAERRLRGLGLGYWEAGFDAAQDQVFPVYLLDLEFLRADTVAERRVIRVPAAEDFMPFLAYIEEPAGSRVVVLGEPVTLAGGADYGAGGVSLDWLSSLDGWRGSGESLVDSTLSEGRHTITLCARDGGGAADTLRTDLRVTSEVDFGDAPAPYPTLLADDGARHFTGGPLWLGGGVDDETDGAPSAAADGDDGANLDDEDGVAALGEWAPGDSVQVAVTCSAPGLLSLWLDLAGDGDWSDPGDGLAADLALPAGATTLSLSLPSTASPGERCLRARLSTQPGLGPAGPAPDGEVEDHLVTLACRVSQPAGALPEGEACGLRLNNGCSLAVPAFIDLDCGDTWWAETWAAHPRRDSDWYELQVAEPTRVLLTVESEIPLVAGLVEQVVPGQGGCAGITGYVDPLMDLAPCTPESLVIDLPAAGTYWLITLPPVFDGYPCSGGPYHLTVHVDCLALAPELEIAVAGSLVTLSWPPVAGASRYHVWGCGQPYPGAGDWTRLTPAEGVADTTWSTTASTARSFYRVVAEGPALRGSVPRRAVPLADEASAPPPSMLRPLDGPRREGR